MKDKIIKTIKDNPRERLEIEIGDVKQADFFPQVKFKKWDNEVNFSIRYDNNSRDYVKKDHKVVCEGNEDVVLYELSEGFEFEIILKQKPSSNIFNYSIETKGLDFFYQPELTQKEKDSGASRPDNVVGSYAVYHKTKRNNNLKAKHDYKTGKFLHIYRPKAIDASGVEAWCDLNITGNKLSVTVPQDFLDKASYPVIVDPTFGYTTAGGSWTGGADRLSTSHKSYVETIYQFNDNDSTILSFSAYVRSQYSDWTFSLGIYEYVSSSSIPYVDNSETITFKQSGGSWKNANSVNNSSLINNKNYLLAWWSGTNNFGEQIAYDNTSIGDSSLFKTRTYDNNDWINDFTTGGNGATTGGEWSIYITYEEAASEPIIGPFPTFRRQI